MVHHPTAIEIHFCPTHGPFVDGDWPEGCPVQVDYDGITCGFIDPEPRMYYRQSNF